MSIGIPLGVTNYLLVNYYSGKGKIATATAGIIIGVLCNIIVSYVLIPRYGLLGAGISFVCSNTISGSYITALFLKENKNFNVASLFYVNREDYVLLKNKIQILLK